MSSTLVVRECGVDNYEWLDIDATDTLPQLIVGDGERLLDESKSAAQVILLADAEKVLLREVSFEDHERKLLRQTLPYTLEDDCVEDVDTLHFSLGEIQGNSVAVAIIKQEDLQVTLASIEKNSFEVNQLVSELSYIPIQENSWSIVVHDDRFLVKASKGKGFTIDSTLLPLTLQLMLDESDVPPESVIVYCLEEQRAELAATFPEMLKDIVEWHEEGYWQLIVTGAREPNVSAINLLQGDFAPSLPWRKWWGMWRVAAVLLMSAAIVQLAVTFTEMKVLENRNLEIRTAIEQRYRSVVPRGAVMDAEKQLRRKVNNLKGSGGEGFVSLLAKITPVLTTIDGLSVQNMNYSEKQSEVRLNIIAAGFNDVETARNNLEKLGLKAELTGSSADGSQTRARLKISG